MARAKTTVQPPQSAEDVELATQTITAAFTATMDKRCAELEAARAEVRRLEQAVADAAGRRAAWIDNGTITETTALDAHSFAHRATFDLLRGVTTPAALACLDPGTVDAARRQAAVTKRWLADHNLLPAELVDPNRRAAR